MTNAELLAKIKVEIERLKSIGGIVPLDNREQKTGYESALIDVETFLDTLESETTYDTQQYTPRPSVEIEDVARVQFASHAKVFDKKRKAVFDWEQFKEVAGIFYGFGKKDRSNTIESEKPINPDAAMKELDEKIALVKQRGTWDGVDVDKYMDEVRGREPEKPMVLEGEIKRFVAEYGYERSEDILLIAIVARHFYDLGCRRTAEKADEIEYNRQRAEEDTPKDLEEAAEKYAYEGMPDEMKSYVKPVGDEVIKNFIAGAKWQAEQDDKELSEKIASAYQLGLADKEKQMMKEAIHYVVQDDLDSHGASYNIPFIRLGTVALKPKGIGVGDKVRIIIVKED